MRLQVAISTAAALLVAGSAMADTYSNGPFVTGVGNGFGGGNTSSIDPTHNSFGIGSAFTANVFVADDFTVGAGGWDISSATFYMYQTVTTPAVNPLANTITSVRVGVYSAAPSGTNITPDFGDFTTNRQTGGSFTGTFRVTSTTLTNDDRAILAITVDMSWLADLAPGTYWLAYTTTGSNASGPWQVPVTPASSGHNARQIITTAAAPGNVWAQIDGNSVTAGTQALDLAFDLEYTAVPAPGAVALAGLAGLTGLRRRRA